MTHISVRYQLVFPGIEPIDLAVKISLLVKGIFMKKCIFSSVFVPYNYCSCLMVFGQLLVVGDECLVLGGSGS